MSNFIKKTLAKAALASAKTAAGTASSWNVYQPKEPNNIKSVK